MKLLVILLIALLFAARPIILLGSNAQAQEQYSGSQGTTGMPRTVPREIEDGASTRSRAKAIKNAISKDKSLSTSARHVRVISSWHGTVTLKGQVTSEHEKQALEMKAAEIVGPDRVNTEVFVPSRADSDRYQ